MTAYDVIKNEEVKVKLHNEYTIAKPYSLIERKNLKKF